MFDLWEHVEEFALAFALGLGRGVIGSVQMNGVSFFFFSRCRELGVRDGEMSPLSFQAKPMIILTGNFLFLLCIPEHIILPPVHSLQYSSER